ncbi:MAG: hypothetical protein WCO68_11200 [Verrucomicrobiota bacterium]
MFDNSRPERPVSEPQAADGVQRACLEMERLAFTPAEIAGMFGRHYSWAYRQIYRGNLRPLKGSASLLISLNEANRFLSQVQEYDGRPRGNKKSKTAKGSQNGAPASTCKKAAAGKTDCGISPASMQDGPSESSSQVDILLHSGDTDAPPLPPDDDGLKTITPATKP